MAAVFFQMQRLLLVTEMTPLYAYSSQFVLTVFGMKDAISIEQITVLFYLCYFMGEQI